MMPPPFPCPGAALSLVRRRGPAGFGAWVDGEQARVRLIAAGVGPDGRLEAGIEIKLAPGWKTYWRSPGAAASLR